MVEAVKAVGDEEMHMCDCEFCHWCGHNPGKEPEMRELVIDVAIHMVEQFLADEPVRFQTLIEAVQDLTGANG